MTTTRTQSLVELRSQALDAERSARWLTSQALQVTRTARRKMAAVDRDIRIANPQKRAVKHEIMNEALAEHQTLSGFRAGYQEQVERFVAAALRAPSGGGVAEQLARGRAADQIQRTLDAAGTDQVGAFSQMITDAMNRSDLPTLEALREMSPHLAARGADVSQWDRVLAATAGPPIAVEAVALEERAKPGFNWTANGLGTAKSALHESLNDPVETLAVDYDRNLIPVDDAVL